MGNWSCLYHWLEFHSPGDAESAFRQLLGVSAYFDQEGTADKWALRFGYIDATTLQVISSQKWGLDPDIAWWVCKDLSPKTIVQAGIDRDCFFQTSGSPEKVVPLYDQLRFIGWQPSRTHQFPGVRGCGNGSIVLRQSTCFSRTHFGEDELAFAGPGKTLIQSIYDQFQADENAEQGHVAFGRCIGNRILFLGSLYMENDGFAFTTTGCHNVLIDEITLGPYRTPIEDEHEPIVENGFFLD